VLSPRRTLAERLGADAPRWSWPSESIAAGTTDPAAVIALWLDEPPDGWHRRNLLDPEQRVVGVGFCANPDDPSGNRLYWTMNRHAAGAVNRLGRRRQRSRAGPLLNLPLARVPGPVARPNRRVLRSARR